MPTLFAWVVPAWSSKSPVDHTWVTSYDSRVTVYPDVAAVSSANQSYWFCWGSFHPKGGIPSNTTGFIGSANGNLALANCLVKENADTNLSLPARGTIFRYGVDGVCHQLANQVLYATKSAASSPLICSKARGYMASNFVYGTYGLQHEAWQAKIASCTGSPKAVGPLTKDGLQMFAIEGDFEKHARQVLKDEELLARLLALRAEVQAYTAQGFPGYSPPTVQALNERNMHLLDQARILLGPEKFEAVFGFNAEEGIDLVDPKVQDRGRFE